MLPQSLQDAPRIYQGARVNVHQVQLTGRAGQTVQRDLIVHPGAVVILPLLGDDQLALIRNHRYAVGSEIWELPAGTREDEEAPERCAARELTEETGYKAGRLKQLAVFYSAPGFCTEKLFAFAAYDLEQVGQKLEATEKITVEVLDWKKAIQMIRNNEICDAKTMATLLYYHAFERDAD